MGSDLPGALEAPAPVTAPADTEEQEPEAAPATEPTDETESNEQEETEPQGSEDSDQDEKLEWPRSAEKRVGKLTAKVTDLSAQVENLRRENEDLKKATPEQAAPVGSGTPQENEIRTAIRKLERAKESIEANIDGYEGKDDQGNLIKATAADMSRWKTEIEGKLVHQHAKLEGHREAMQNARRESLKKAEVAHPELRDKSTQLYQHVHAALRMYPDAAQILDIEHVLSDAFKYRALQVAQANARPAPAPRPAPTNRVSPRATSAPVTPKTNKLDAATARLAKNGADYDAQKDVLKAVLDL